MRYLKIFVLFTTINFSVMKNALLIAALAITVGSLSTFSRNPVKAEKEKMTLAPITSKPTKLDATSFQPVDVSITNYPFSGITVSSISVNGAPVTPTDDFPIAPGGSGEYETQGEGDGSQITIMVSYFDGTSPGYIGIAGMGGPIDTVSVTQPGTYTLFANAEPGVPFDIVIF